MENLRHARRNLKQSDHADGCVASHHRFGVIWTSNPPLAPQPVDDGLFSLPTSTSPSHTSTTTRTDVLISDSSIAAPQTAAASNPCSDRVSSLSTRNKTSTVRPAGVALASSALDRIGDIDMPSSRSSCSPGQRLLQAMEDDRRPIAVRRSEMMKKEKQRSAHVEEEGENRISTTSTLETTPTKDDTCRRSATPPVLLRSSSMPSTSQLPDRGGSLSSASCSRELLWSSSPTGGQRPTQLDAAARSRQQPHIAATASANHTVTAADADVNVQQRARRPGVPAVAAVEIQKLSYDKITKKRAASNSSDDGGANCNEKVRYREDAVDDSAIPACHEVDRERTTMNGTANPSYSSDSQLADTSMGRSGAREEGDDRSDEKLQHARRRSQLLDAADEGLEGKISRLHRMVGDLRGCMEGLGKKRRASVGCMEEEDKYRRQQEKEVRARMERQLEAMLKVNIADEVKKLTQGLRGELPKVEKDVRRIQLHIRDEADALETAAAEAASSCEGVDVKANPPSMTPSVAVANTALLMQQIESLVGNMKAEVVSEVTERILQQQQSDATVSDKTNGVELGLVAAATLCDDEKKSKDSAVVEQKNVGMVSREWTIAEMKNELQLVWEEMELLAAMAEETKQKLVHEQSLLKLENGQLRKQLHCLKSEMSAEHDQYRHEMEKIMRSSSRSHGQEVNKGHPVVTELELESAAATEQQQRQEEELEKWVEKAVAKRDSSLLIMEKVEGISRFYLRGLDDLRQQLCSVKLSTEQRVEALESQCTDNNLTLTQRMDKMYMLLEMADPTSGNVNVADDQHRTNVALDNLEARVLALENKLANDFVERSKAMATLAEDKEQCAAALHRASAAAYKADSLLSEMQLVLKQSQDVQQALAAAASDVTRMEDTEKEIMAKKMMSHGEELCALKDLVAAHKETAAIVMSLTEVCKSQAEWSQRCEKMAADYIRRLERQVQDMADEGEARGPASVQVMELEEKGKMLQVEMQDMGGRLRKAESTLEDLQQLRMNGEEAMKRKMEGLEKKVEDALHVDVGRCSWEQQRIQGQGMEEMRWLQRKVEDMEACFTEMGSVVKEMQRSSAELQNSAVMWLHKYDGLFQDMEQRLSALEKEEKGGCQRQKKRKQAVARNGDESASQEQKEVAEEELARDIESLAPGLKERLLNLYSGFLRRTEAAAAAGDGGGGIAEMELQGSSRCVEARMAQLETELASNFRALDEKMEKFRVVVETALEGASVAETKCGALGGEVVKLFRMITAAKPRRRSSPCFTTSVSSWEHDVVEGGRPAQYEHRPYSAHDGELELASARMYGGNSKNEGKQRITSAQLAAAG